MSIRINIILPGSSQFYLTDSRQTKVFFNVYEMNLCNTWFNKHITDDKRNLLTLDIS